MAEYIIPRCQIVPQSDSQTAVLIDGRQVLIWNFGSHLPRPCFHPVIGPSGANLVRMGHPGAPNHDHHAGLWFAHNMVEGIDFWANGTGSQIRQRQWLDYVDSDDYAALSFILDYYDGHEPDPLLSQRTIAIVSPLKQREFLIEFSLSFESPQGDVTLRQTNFGVIAARVSATVSEFFGGGVITNDNGTETEAKLFGKQSAYMDYSGPVRGNNGEMTVNGLTLFDHQDNPNFPAKWHVREDGWMGPSLNRDAALTISEQTPLRLRYQVHVHDGGLNPQTARRLQAEFNSSPGWQVQRSTEKHRAWAISRETK